MNDKKVKGLSKVENYYQNYGLRAGELNKEGGKVIGYICSFVPVEMITAAGCIPFRLRGDVHEPITKGDNLMEIEVTNLPANRLRDLERSGIEWKNFFDSTEHKNAKV